MIGTRISLLLLALSGTAYAQDAPAAITTDTAEYCTELAARAEAVPGKTDAVRNLVQTGRALCQRGRPRAGIARLRRAMRAMHDRPVPPSPVPAGSAGNGT